ncbi:MAG: HAD-IA family hydrolase [Clostridia bacterium]|nr:HAD-IA family hydrolase [Clostridia bacterium]
MSAVSHSQIRAVLFDLDDTLYPEIAFVKSGFRAVSHAFETPEFSASFLYSRLESLFLEDRKHVFDHLACEIVSVVRHGAGTNEDLELEIKGLAESMLWCYRNHEPTITLHEDAQRTVTVLKQRGYAVGIITDGLHEVQKRKVAALKLNELADIIIYTDELGPNRQYWKPSPKAFVLAVERLRLSPWEVYYVGDNPEKDFGGPLAIGMNAAWIRREAGIYGNLRPTQEQAILKIDSLTCLLKMLLPEPVI